MRELVDALLREQSGTVSPGIDPRPERLPASLAEVLDDRLAPAGARFRASRLAGAGFFLGEHPP